MKHPIFIELLERYINGECTAEEIAIVKKWYFSFENDDDHVSELTLLEEKKLEERIYSQIISSLGVDGEAEEEIITETATPRRSYTVWYAIAAAAILFIVFGTLLLNNKTSGIIEKQTASSGIIEQVLITNNTHQIYKKVLPDNSIVWLNPKSQIKFPKVFDARFRAISMTGECFFEVTKNPKRPFIINSGSIITKVWGTSFRVRDNADSKRADVSVITGKVSVSINRNKAEDDIDYVLNKGEVMLYPHQKAIYLADKKILKPVSADEPTLQIWTRQNLAFENKPLGDIVLVLNSKFHVHIVVSNERLNHFILNADMTGFNLPDVLEALKKSLNVNYEIKDNEIDLQ
jgi:transmembrane sensor